MSTSPDTGAVDETFLVYLPLTESLERPDPTHVALMHGDEAAFMDVLAELVTAGAPASAPLRRPVDETSLDEIADALRTLGPAEVESIEPLQRS